MPTPKSLPVLAEKLEVGLRVEACRALVRDLGAFVEVAAVPAAPCDRAVSLKDPALFEILVQG